MTAARLLGLAICLAGLAWESAALAMDPALTPVRAYLMEQGVPAPQVQAIMEGPGVVFEAKILANMLSRHERTLDYRQFLSPGSVAKARRFAHQRAALLESARRATGVDPTVVVAILTIESGLGSYTGRWLTFSVLASQAVLDHPPALARLAQAWPKSQAAYLGSAECRERFGRRAQWARGEVLGLVQLAQQRRVPVLSFRGSPAGALGMPQFVPTSVLRWGVDGDRDGRLDLSQPPDAIFSVANYLKEHGWRPGLSRQERYQVVHTYNHSQVYVNTVLELAARIAG